MCNISTCKRVVGEQRGVDVGQNVDVGRSSYVVAWEYSAELDDTIRICLGDTAESSIVLNVE